VVVFFILKVIYRIAICIELQSE